MAALLLKNCCKVSLRLFVKPVQLSDHPVTFIRGKKLWMKPFLKSLYRRRLEQGPEPERPRSVWINWNYEAELYSFGKRLGENLNNDTLRRAFTNSSYLAKEKTRRSQLEMDDQLELKDNEELVQSGFEISKSFISIYIRHCWPLLPDDGVRSVSNYLLNDGSLAYIAANLGIKDLVLTEEFPPSGNTMSRSLKAVIGAIAIDQGRERAELFVHDFILTQLVGKSVLDVWNVTNPMGVLTDVLKAQQRGAPEPRLLWSAGSSTILASYLIGIYSDKNFIAKGAGETVLIAEEMAARNSLLCLLHLTDSRPPFPFSRSGHKLQLTSTQSFAHSTISARQ